MDLQNNTVIDLNHMQVGRIFKGVGMTRYPMQELSFSELLKRSVRLHYLTLKHTIFCILFMTITKYACILLLGLFLNTYSQDVIYIVAALIMAYFFLRQCWQPTMRLTIDQSLSMIP